MDLRSGKTTDPVSEQGDLIQSETSVNQQIMLMLSNLNSKFDKQQQEINNKLDRQQVDLKSAIQNIESQINTKFENVQRDQETKLENIKKYQVELYEKISNALEKKVNNIENEVTVVKHNLEQIKDIVVCEVQEKLGHQVGEVVTLMQDEIINLKENIEKNQRHTNESINLTVMNDNVSNDIKFYGDNRISPKIFLKQLKAQISNVRTENIKNWLRSKLRGDAEIWFDIQEENIQNFDDFEKLFLKYFWNEHVQNKIREKLYIGRYNPEFGQTREKYALNKYNIARQLEPKILEKDIINYLARHFHDDIKTVVALNDVVSIDKFIDYLRRIDDMRPIRKRNISYRWDGGRANQDNRLERDPVSSHKGGERENKWTDRTSLNRSQNVPYKRQDRTQNRQNFNRNDFENRNTNRQYISDRGRENQINNLEEIVVVHEEQGIEKQDF